MNSELHLLIIQNQISDNQVLFVADEDTKCPWFWLGVPLVPLRHERKSRWIRDQNLNLNIYITKNYINNENNILFIKIGFGV